MGVDARYLHGYIAENSEVELDIDFMKENFDLNRKVDDKPYENTYGEWVEWLENDEIDDWDGFYDALGLKCRYVYDDGHFVCLEIKKLIELFPDTKLKDLNIAKDFFLKSRGIKNPEVFTLYGFAYFD